MPGGEVIPVGRQGYLRTAEVFGDGAVAAVRGVERRHTARPSHVAERPGRVYGHRVTEAGGPPGPEVHLGQSQGHRVPTDQGPDVKGDPPTPVDPADQ